MDYEKYLDSSAWKQMRKNRLAFDNWQCAFCHLELEDRYETHHLNYERLGHEDMEHDIVSLCPRCHSIFHERWNKNEYWHDSPMTHWKNYSLKHTADLCVEIMLEDYFYGGQRNLCSEDTVEDYITQYITEHADGTDIYICATDIMMLFRNLRYHIFLNAVSNGEGLEDMLDRMFGKKGGKGGNPIRANARRFLTKHKIGYIKRFIRENDNLLILESEVNKSLSEKENESYAETH